MIAGGVSRFPSSHQKEAGDGTGMSGAGRVWLQTGHQRTHLQTEGGVHGCQCRGGVS